MYSAIRWFINNPVAANLLMLSIIALGIYSIAKRLPLEVFPDISYDVITIITPYPGATPSEIEESVTKRVEQSIADLDGIEEIKATITEGVSRVNVSVMSDYNSDKLMNDIKSRVDAINNLPDDIEKSIVSQGVRKREVISVIVFSDASERELRNIAQDVKEDLIKIDGISQVELEDIRDPQINIEIPIANLRRYNLDIEKIKNIIKNNTVDIAAGTIESPSGDVLIKAKTQAYSIAEFSKIIILKEANGAVVYLKDIATIDDSFEDKYLISRFNGKQAIEIEVFRVGKQSAIDIADKVKAYIKKNNQNLPKGTQLSFWRDRSKIVKSRLKTLTNSAIQGGLLVIILLSLFLRPKVAFWVSLGIPVSFMGAFILMPFFDVTINIVSLFAFIIVLGIVVDDAIVTGENIFTHLKNHESGFKAALEGTQEVAIPVTFGVLTTVVAFVPLLLVEGMRGKLFAQIPMIVIPVLLFSLIESKLVLPSHLRNIKINNKSNVGVLEKLRLLFADGLETFIQKYYRPFLAKVIDRRYLTLSIFTAIAMIVITLATSGWIKFTFFPKVQSEVLRVNLTMPTGTSTSITDSYIKHIMNKALKLKEDHIEKLTGESIVTGILSVAKNSSARVFVEVKPPEERKTNITSTELLKKWRKSIGKLAGIESINYRAEIGRTSDPIDIQLVSNNTNSLKTIVNKINSKLSSYPDVYDIADSLNSGKQELRINLKPEAKLLGLTIYDVASQVRNAIYGLKVKSIQRDIDDVDVKVRYPKTQRNLLSTLENLPIVTKTNYKVPFFAIAYTTADRSPATIYRIDKKKVINVTADYNKQSGNLSLIKTELKDFINNILINHPDVTYSFEGEDKEQRESFASMLVGLIGLLFAVYILLAIPLKSYYKPLVIMAVIPFGAVGAILGHMIMGYNLTILSLMGALALTGVVINDSLVLVAHINRILKVNTPVKDILIESGCARFRPILLTSLTTFAGLAPIIFEKSTQAQFLIPMAISLGYGILFATFVTVFLIPINYAIADDVKNLFKKYLS